MREQLRLFERREVATFRHMRPALHVVDPLDPASRRHHNFLGKKGDSAGHADTITWSKFHGTPAIFPVKTHRRRHALREPINGDVGEQFVFCEDTFDFAFAVAPGAELFDDPSGESDGRIVQRIGETLWLGGLNAEIATFRVKPVRIRREERFFFFREVAPREIAWRLKRTGNAIQMRTDDAIRKQKAKAGNDTCAPITALYGKALVTEFFDDNKC